MMQRTLCLLLLSGLAFQAGCQHPDSTTAAQIDTQGALRVKKIIVTDDQGRDRVYIGPVEHKGRKIVGVVLLDEQDKRRVVVGTSSDGNAGMVVLDEEGKPRVITGSFRKDTGSGTVYLDGDGKPRITIGTDDTNGDAEIDVIDSAGNEIHTLETKGGR